MIIDGLNKVIQLKIVIHGAGMSGKTTFLKSILSKVGSPIHSMENSVHRTLNCDYGNLNIPFNNWTIKVHLYSTAGANYYEVTRPIILSGCDGLIFIVDLQKDELRSNVNAWNELTTYFSTELDLFPLVVAFNKHDLRHALNKDEFLETIQIEKCKNCELVESIAIKDLGTVEALEALLDLVLKRFNVISFISDTWCPAS